MSSYQHFKTQVPRIEPRSPFLQGKRFTYGTIFPSPSPPVWERVSCMPSRPWIYCVAKYHLALLIFMLLPPEHWDSKPVDTPSLCCAGDSTWGFLHARWVLFQLSHVSCHPRSFCPGFYTLWSKIWALKRSLPHVLLLSTSVETWEPGIEIYEWTGGFQYEKNAELTGK